MKTKKNNFKGGKMIDSGGYGCVFSPALKCKNKSRKKGYVTKLLTNKYGIAEYKDLKKINSILKKIPNYKSYFVGPEVYKCHVQPLTSEDKENIESCKPMKKGHIEPTEINKNLKRVLALNFIHGGKTILKFVKSIKSIEDLKRFNLSMIDVLQKGIVPLNENNVVHADLKESNMLIDSNFKVRLIDWGLSGTILKNKVSMHDRPLQYNLPYSTLIVDKYTVDDVNKFLESVKKIDKDVVKKIAGEVLNVALSEREMSLFLVILHTYVFDYNDEHASDEVKKSVIDYLTNILINFIENKNGKYVFNRDKYVKEVFRKNVDVYGFLTCYLEVAEELQHSSDGKILSFTKNVKKLAKKYLYNDSFASEAIPTDILVDDLKTLV
jgi:serine/threonine protein kinase